MLLIAVALVVAAGAVLLAPYWLGKAWARDGLWELRDDVYDEWRRAGYDSLVLSKFVHRTEVAIDQLHRMSIWTLWSTHSVLRKIGREEMSALFPEPAELAHLPEAERTQYDAWDTRFNDLVARHLFCSSWSGIALYVLAVAASRMSRHQSQRAEQMERRLRDDSHRLVAAAGSSPNFSPC